MDDLPDSKNNMDESPASASPAQDESPSSPSPADASTPDPRPCEKLTPAPEPPRWRFVADAKKSLGYSSLHAGSYVQGQSSDDLGAKYVAPDISLYKPEKEAVVGSQAVYQFPTNIYPTKEDVVVGKLATNVPPQNAFSTSNHEVGRLQIIEDKSSDTQSPSGTFAGLPKFESPTDEPRKPFKEWDANLQVGPQKKREHEWWDGKINDAYTMPGDDAQSKTRGEAGRIKFHDPGEFEEIFVGEIAKRNPDHDGDGGDDFEDDYGDAREGALFIHHNSSASSATDKGIDGSAVSTDPVDDENERRKRFHLYLLLLILLVLVIVLGVLLGQKNGDERVVAAGVVGGVLIPPIVVVNETSVPSSYPSSSPSIENSLQPSLSPSMECPAGTKAFSIEHLHQSEHYLPKIKREHHLPTTINGATLKIKDACSGEVIAQCLPCSLGSLTLSLPRSPLTQPRSNGPTRHLEKLHENITECLPINNEYALEVLPTEGPDACCGFDPTTSIISYDDVMIIDMASGSIIGDVLNMYFGVRETPCASESPSASPTVTGSERPSLVPSQDPSGVPSTTPSSSPSLSPSTSTPTQGPVLFLGGCPETFIRFLDAYVIGTQVESNGIIYKCISSSCGSYGFEPGQYTSSLWRQGWEVVGSCSGTMAPTSYPTVPPTTSPTNSPSGTPSRSPSKTPTTSPSPAPTTRQRTRHPTKLPSTKPTCSIEQEFNLCLAIDMSGSVCNDGMGSECLECRASFLPMFFTSECRDRFVSEDTCCNNFANVKEFSSLMVNLLGDFPAEKSFSVVQFATNARLVSRLSSTAQTLPVINRLDYTGGLTNHASAIRMCQQTLPTFDNRKNFIMLITDGVSSEPEFDPEGAAEAAAISARNGETFIIPVFISPDNDWSALAFMRRLSSDGKVFDVTDFGSLNSLQDRLVDQVSCS